MIANIPTATPTPTRAAGTKGALDISVINGSFIEIISDIESYQSEDFRGAAGEYAIGNR